MRLFKILIGVACGAALVALLLNRKRADKDELYEWFE